MPTVENFSAWLRDYAAVVHDNAGLLTDLDSAIGDADHGSNMDRGMTAIVALLDANTFDTADALFKKVGMTLVSTVGGASGPLYGTFFLRFGAALQGVDPIGAPALGAALRAGVDGVLARGKADLDDKTMYDALAPALAAYDAATGDGIGPALAAAASAAAAGRDRVTPLVARKGRASYLGERSADHQDPGATSVTLLLESAAATLS
ncbi:dihydroxyacetone kinase subunit DhaL [Mycolicibacterium komossense]|uniref:Dihydroxyacetone kinase subunit L n=1 Tax=Mycolicibacterium komossense TaxID=1779 RepID=A0ABT3CGN4_9MYCO|nr:dihydroxyacetone kinase subunit DhaL [Mycolicibacterium komossense]MCV7228589.1 dihydroxyacetone kinase subunit L [Mycolicibacterium komossense]